VTQGLVESTVACMGVWGRVCVVQLAMAMAWASRNGDLRIRIRGRRALERSFLLASSLPSLLAWLASKLATLRCIVLYYAALSSFYTTHTY
jgi:hypothetical protein